jgi:hypothetical protein
MLGRRWTNRPTALEVSEMSEFDIETPVPEEDVAEREVLSEETGTIYDETGEAETTPHDLEDDDEDEE